MTGLLLLLGVALLAGAGALSAAVMPSKNAVRFDAMVDDFKQIRAQEIDLVDDARFRELLHSCRGALGDEKVLTAFRVLYEDIAPVRVGGDLIFKKLTRAVSSVVESSSEVVASVNMDTAERARFALEARRYLGESLEWPGTVVDQFLANVLAEVERETASLAAGRRVFAAFDTDASGRLDLEELEQFGDVITSVGQCADCTCNRLRTCDAVTRLMVEVEQDNPGQNGLSFESFMTGYARTLGANSHDRADELVSALLSRNDNSEANYAPHVFKVVPASSSRASKHRLRFDQMVDDFGAWGEDPAIVEKANAANPRLALVLDGCFAGAKNPSVVNALRMLYEDYTALRLVGDLIFKLMKKLVGK